VNLVETKHCPICEKDLPLSSFGACRARSDGKNLYCRDCINAKVTASRVGKKNWRQIQRDRKAKALEVVTEKQKSSIEGRVIEAIALGFNTQKLIANHTGLRIDDVGDIIANLLLWKDRITTELSGETRRYFLIPEPREVERKQNSVAVRSLTCFGPVMRGRTAA
jgi:hypothetical protein